MLRVNKLRQLRALCQAQVVAVTNPCKGLCGSEKQDPSRTLSMECMERFTRIAEGLACSGSRKWPSEPRRNRLCCHSTSLLDHDVGYISAILLFWRSIVGCQWSWPRGRFWIYRMFFWLALNACRLLKKNVPGSDSKVFWGQRLLHDVKWTGWGQSDLSPEDFLLQHAIHLGSQDGSQEVQSTLAALGDAKVSDRDCAEHDGGKRHDSANQTSWNVPWQFLPIHKLHQTGVLMCNTGAKPCPNFGIFERLRCLCGKELGSIFRERLAVAWLHTRLQGAELKKRVQTIQATCNIVTCTNNEPFWSIWYH